MVVFRLVMVVLMPILLSIIFYILEKKTKWREVSYKKRQIIIGFAFGIIAYLSTDLDTSVRVVQFNVWTAAPLTAGLLFGGTAGVLAGVLGGIQCLIAELSGAASYGTLACALGTILAGFIGAACRKYMFDNKKSSCAYGLVIGMAVEVIHMLLIFITNMDDINTAFAVVRKYAIPMIVVNGISVVLAMLVISIMGKEKRKKQKEQKQITQTFSVALCICVMVAFAVTSIFTFVLQNKIGYRSANDLLRLNIQDVKADIMDASDRNLLEITHSIAEEIAASGICEEINSESDDATRESKRTILNEMLNKYQVTDINIIDENGIIILSTYKDFDLYYMGQDKGGQAEEFLCLLDEKEEYVQGYGPVDYSDEISRKYAGVALTDGGFVQVGYGAEQFQDSIAEEVQLAAQNRHIGQDGLVMICKEETLEIVSSPDFGISEEVFNSFSVDFDKDSAEEGEFFRIAGVLGNEMFCMYQKTEGYVIIGCLPVEEALFSRDISVCISIFMQIFVFSALFVLIYLLVKRIVVDNIHKINISLSKITSGDLNTKVDVRDNKEFASLSDDINYTVATLKDYIAEAAARIDKDLEFAKAIQLSALPRVFPPYPNRSDFDIYATMDTAKEVGGDFYDFYLLDNDKLGFLVADVSGKGIPAAMFMMTAKTIIKSYVEAGIEVNDVFTKVNEKLCESNEAGMFVTAWLGILDLTTGVLSYANAGHNFPLLRKKNGAFEYLKCRPNLFLAGMEGVKYQKNELQLQPGDEIYLYTDGVTEATNAQEELFGDDRLRDTLNKNPNEGVEMRLKTVKEDIDKFVGEADQFDDITMLSVKLKFYQNEDSIVTSPDMETTESVWAFIDSKTKKAGLSGKVTNRIQVVVDEIYSNILRYSEAEYATVSCILEEEIVKLVFRDNGMEYNPLEKEDPDTTLSIEERAIGGLGIYMVKNMAKDVSYEYVEGQNVLTVTFTLV